MRGCCELSRQNKDSCQIPHLLLQKGKMLPLRKNIFSGQEKFTGRPASKNLLIASFYKPIGENQAKVAKNIYFTFLLPLTTYFLPLKVEQCETCET